MEDNDLKVQIVKDKKLKNIIIIELPKFQKKQYINEIPDYIELNGKYGNIKHINIALHRNNYGKVAGSIIEIDKLIKDFQKQKDFIISAVKNYFGLSLEEKHYNIYNPLGVKESVVIDTDKYTECLLDWIYGFENHLIDLKKLLKLSFKNKGVCIVNCYLELKSISRKILFAISEGECEYKSYEELIALGEEEYQYIIDNAKDLNFNELYDKYYYYYKTICQIGDYIFVYLGRYEEICYSAQNEFKKVLLAQEEIRNELKQNSNK